MTGIRLILSLLLSHLLVFCSTESQSQPAFEIRLEPVTIDGIMGVQSFAYGQSDNKWLILGGRKDGLHRRQPFAAFETEGANNNLLVIDPANMQTWSASLTALSNELQEQLSATNMQFHQEENTLYIIGGYEFSNAAEGFTTFGKLCAVDVQGAIAAIINGTPLTPYFRQYDYPDFAVTGGHRSAQKITVTE